MTIIYTEPLNFLVVGFAFNNIYNYWNAIDLKTLHPNWLFYIESFDSL